jgi:mannosylglycerate hydrolase
MRNLHVVSHTHWDREWYLPFQLFRLKLVHLVDGLLEILEKDRDFKHFMLDGQTIVLDDYLHMRPENELILRQHIRTGRILIGPWHILPDIFLVGPEAHIRNLLQGDLTARKFGPKMMVGYMPDSFGHIGQFPQILCGFGIQVASLWRGVLDGPAEFWWQAPNGSRVLMAYLRFGYGNGADLPAGNLERFAHLLAEKGADLSDVSATSELLIMYGTDHMEPPPNTSEAINYADEMLPNTHVLHSTLPQYIAAIQASINKNKIELPTIVGELRDCKRMHLLPGVLSTRMWIKQRNHACETILLRWAEPFSIWQESVTGPQSTILNQKSGILHQTWRLLMENHPHDSICGCSIDQVHEEMKVRFDQVEQVGEEISRQSLASIASRINTVISLPGFENRQRYNGEYLLSIVIFNPLSTSSKGVVPSDFELPPGITEFELVDENGVSVPFQEIGQGNHEIINMSLDSRSLQSAFGNIHEGRAAGMTVQDLRISRHGTVVHIEAIMAKGGEPNLSTWNSGRKQIMEDFADPSVTSFHIHARSTSSTQVIISVPEVPGLGYRTLWVCARSIEEKAPLRIGPLAKALLPLARLPSIHKLAARTHYAHPPYNIENDFFKVEAIQDGTLILYDKQTGTTYQGLNHFLDGGDCGDEYNFAPPVTDQITTPKLKHVTFLKGPLQQSLEIELNLTTPLTLSTDRKVRSKEHVTIPIKTTVTLSKSIPRLDISTSVDNRARDHRLRVHFPAPFAAGRGFHDGHFEVVERMVGVPTFDKTWAEQPRPEVPQRAFTCISDGKSGLTVANRGLTEVEILNNATGNAEIAVTLIRCVGWLSRDDFSTRKNHAGPPLETPGAQVPGTWTFDYSIIPHSGGWKNSFVQAFEFETPMRSIATGLHQGTLPVSGSFVVVTPGTFVISTVKSAESGAGWILRGYNITSELIQVKFKPWKSFRKAEQVNLAEEKQVTLKSDLQGCFTIPVRGHEIISVLFQD